MPKYVVSQLRSGGALKMPFAVETLPTVGIDEMVHNLREKEDTPPESMSFPDYQRVLCEDDIVGEKAAIAYEENLRQLTGFLRLPLEKCKFSDPLVGVECDAVQPFEVIIKSRGTATTIEWVRKLL